MYYIIGVFRRTALWGMFLVILASIAIGCTEFLYLLLYLLGAYLFFVLIHLLACKFSKGRRSLGEAYLSALGYDLVAPFSKIGLLIAVVFKKWVIHDRTKFLDFIDGVQVVAGGIWAIAVLGAVIYLVLEMVL